MKVRGPAGARIMNGRNDDWAHSALISTHIDEPASKLLFLLPSLCRRVLKTLRSLSMGR